MRIAKHNIASFGFFLTEYALPLFFTALLLSTAMGEPPVESGKAKATSRMVAEPEEEALGDDAGIEAFRRASPLARPLLLPSSKPTPFNGTFSANEETVVGIIGSTNAVELSRYGYFDTLLGINGMPVKTRNLAWEADTVYFQQRPRSFYTERSFSNEDPDTRERIQADVFLLWLGQTESLEGPEGCDAFSQRYEEIVRMLQVYTGRVILVTPAPFENPLNIPYDVEARNANLAQYASAIRKIGEDRNLLVVDLFSALSARSEEAPLTSNGLYLNAQGHWAVAQAFARQLGLADTGDTLAPEWPDESLANEKVEAARQMALWRNELWYRFWRPTNWAFLYGNRQHVPSSFDHENRSQRWFPGEVDSTLIPLAEAESDLQQVHKQLADD